LKDNKITINSESEKNNKIVKKIFKELIDILEEGHLPEWNQFLYIISRSTGEDIDTSKSMKEVVNTTINGVKISAKTGGQAKYIEDLKNNEIVFSIGPAGTGKTYLAVAMAVDYLKKGKVQRLILTRPAVEAGEKLGFLPGTLYEKVDPYLKPLYDSLIDFLGVEKVNFYKEKGIIEIVPLAYMRGRTLNNSFIILDEAQNSTYQQMKMFLTRIGFNSQVVVTGDITQIDLEKKKDSGLLAVSKFLTNIKGIKFNELKKSDVVRNPLVKEIINAYEIFEKDSE
jgi:phosphate starvation-inducible PhoH-like protein